MLVLITDGTTVIMDGIILGRSTEVLDLAMALIGVLLILLFIGTEDSMVEDSMQVFTVDSTTLFTETMDSLETEVLDLETIVIMQATEDIIILIEEIT